MSLIQKQQKFIIVHMVRSISIIAIRQDTLNLENKLKVHDWSKIVNMTLFVMMVIDVWLDFNGFTLAEETQKDFYTIFSEELIDNSYKNSNMARQSRRNGDDGNLSASPNLAAGTGAPREVSRIISLQQNERELENMVQ